MMLRVHYNGLVYLGFTAIHQFGTHLVLIRDGASYSGITCGFSQPFHANLQLFLCYTKYMVNFSCFNYHEIILSFDFLSTCNGLTTHHSLSLINNLVNVNLNLSNDFPTNAKILNSQNFAPIIL